MERLLEYRDDTLYCHHSLDERPNPAQYDVHAHEMLEVYCFLAGAGHYLVEGTLYALEPGDILIMRAAETHKLLLEPGQPYERIAIHFSPEALRPLDPQGALLRPFLDRPLGRLNQYRAQHFRGAHWKTAFADFSFPEPRTVRAHILGRLLTLLPELCDAFDGRGGQLPAPNDPAYRLVSYVNDHLFERLTLKRLCEAFYLSASHLNRLFRGATGTSVWRYVTIKRLLAARAMLQRGEPAGSVCAACGFSDYSAFYRAYVKCFSHPPSGDAPGE